MAKRREAEAKAVRISNRQGQHFSGATTFKRILKRDEPDRCLKRIKKARARYVEIRTAVNFWKPNDRPLKPLKAELDALGIYLRSVERAIQDAVRE